jgi:quinol monooxygenase YgiN
VLTITAIITAKKGHEATMRQALEKVAENVRASEPGTIGFYISQDARNSRVFTTYERFVDQAAMDAHNNSAASQGFFKIARPILEGEVILVIGSEISKKER